VFCSISEQFQRFPFLVGFGLVVRLARFPVNPESGRSGLGGWSCAAPEPLRASTMLAWWSVFCSIYQQRQVFQLLEGLGLVRFLPDFRTDSDFQGIIDVGLVVGVLLNLSAAPGLPAP
jgi:hypothetical protein